MWAYTQLPFVSIEMRENQSPFQLPRTIIFHILPLRRPPSTNTQLQIAIVFVPFNVILLKNCGNKNMKISIYDKKQ